MRATMVMMVVNEGIVLNLSAGKKFNNVQILGKKLFKLKKDPNDVESPKQIPLIIPHGRGNKGGPLMYSAPLCNVFYVYPFGLLHGFWEFQLLLPFVIFTLFKLLHFYRRNLRFSGDIMILELPVEGSYEPLQVSYSQLPFLYLAY